MAKHLARDLDRLQQLTLGMARLVDEAVSRAAQALLARETKVAREVLVADAEIDEHENRIQDECLKILALNQPVAGDLRRIAAVFAITTDLERIGDLAVDISERAIALTEGPEFPVPDKCRRLADFVTSMVRQALEAFVTSDSKLAARVIRLDEEADRLNAEIIAEVIAAMKANPAGVEAGVSLFSVTRHLERIGDHATNIAEDVVYLVEGEIVRHRQGKPETDRNTTGTT